MQSALKQKALNILASAALIAMALPGVPAVNADTSTPAHVTSCDLISHGMTVGHGRIIRTPTLRNSEACMELRLIIETRVNLLFFKFAMQMEESWVTDKSGLIAYKFNSIENGRSKTITGELQDGIFRFETVEAGQKSVWTTPRTAFDLVSNSHPEPALTNGEVKIFTVLDPATCTIGKRTYRGTGPEMLAVGKRQIMGNTIMIECPGIHIRRWFITDEFGPLILREDGRQKRGTYSRRAINMDLEAEVAE
ncbi:MAG: hypothetical protein Q7J98_11925 [Kiritimatiellia bacterium]|nr:hypothetical protein [Kiritimatiellia bacterium]